MKTIDLLNANGYVKNLFPFDRSHLQIMGDISEDVLYLSRQKRKNLFALYPQLKEIISEALNQLSLNCELTDYCFYIEKKWQHNWSLALHQDVNFPDYLNCDDFDRWREDGFWFRINLDSSEKETGALKVVPQSHLSSLAKQETQPIFLENKSGEVVLFKPLLLHGSNKMTKKSRRRIIQAFCLL